MAIILNIETATDRCSVAIADEDKLMALEETEDAYSHSTRLTLMIEKCLLAADLRLTDLDAVAVSAGPGSYTGLRIGCSTAKGICYALNKPLLAINTLHALAVASMQKEAASDALYLPMIDARRMEVYTAGYHKNGQSTFSTRAMILDENSFSDELVSGIPVILSGNGAEKCRQILSHPNLVYSGVLCSASNLIPLSAQAFKQSKFEDLAYFSPFYLKKPNITKPKNIL